MSALSRGALQPPHTIEPSQNSHRPVPVLAPIPPRPDLLIQDVDDVVLQLSFRAAASVLTSDRPVTMGIPKRHGIFSSAAKNRDEPQDPSRVQDPGTCFISVGMPFLHQSLPDQPRLYFCRHLQQPRPEVQLCTDLRLF